MSEDRGTRRHAPDPSDDSGGGSPGRLVPEAPDAPELPCPDCLAYYPRDRYSVAYRNFLTFTYSDPTVTVTYPYTESDSW